MPTQATIVLDSGVLFPKEGGHCEIGYFQCEDSCSDITISIDGEEVDNLPDPFKLGTGAIEVRHLNADGSIKRGGVKSSKLFHKRILHLKDLYGDDQPVERAKFDCVIRFDTGHFSPSMIKKRHFKEHRKQGDGKFRHNPTDAPHETQPIAHNLLVYYTLKDGEALELARGDVVFWSTRNYGIKDRLDIEFMADNSTAEKFFQHSLDDGKNGYWLPNQGDPPPSCPRPPCMETL